MKFLSLDLKTGLTCLKELFPFWQSNTFYKKDDYIKHGNIIYSCVLEHTSDITFDYTKWEILSINQSASLPKFHLESLPNTRTENIKNFEIYPYIINSNQLHVYVDGKRLSCKTDYIEIDQTHVDFINDITPTQHVIFETDGLSNSILNDWQPNYLYNARDIILADNSRLYRAKIDHLSSNNFYNDINNWTLIGENESGILKLIEIQSNIDGNIFTVPQHNTSTKSLLVFINGILQSQDIYEDIDSTHIRLLAPIDSQDYITFMIGNNVSRINDEKILMTLIEKNNIEIPLPSNILITDIILNNIELFNDTTKLSLLLNNNLLLDNFVPNTMKILNVYKYLDLNNKLNIYIENAEIGKTFIILKYIDNVLF